MANNSEFTRGDVSSDGSPVNAPDVNGKIDHTRHVNIGTVTEARKVWSDILNGSGDGVALIKEFVFGVAGLHLDTDDPLGDAYDRGIRTANSNRDAVAGDPPENPSSTETIVLLLELVRMNAQDLIGAVDDVLSDITTATKAHDEKITEKMVRMIGARGGFEFGDPLGDDGPQDGDRTVTAGGTTSKR